VLALALLLFTYFHPGVRAQRRTNGNGDGPHDKASEVRVPLPDATAAGTLPRRRG
jgi:hypothetical protein